jgi:aminoglycoside phosphotransferase (APT) family kinase protein
VQAIAPFAPALAGTLADALGGIQDAVRDRPGPVGVAHGDLKPSRVLFDGPTTGLVTFDRVCLAEPALDLGHFTGHLAAAVATTPGARSGSDGGDLATAFVREYATLDGRRDTDALLARVAAYRTVTLVQIAVRRWSRLQPERLRPVLELLGASRRARVP